MIVNGKLIAESIQQLVSKEIKDLDFVPKLSVILVGNDPASEIYVKRKQEMCKKIGIDSEIHVFPTTITQEHLESFIKELNTDGILVQLPLPDKLDKYRILNTIPPEKDVDCFNAQNIGKLAQGIGILKPCTPSGIIEILDYYKIPTKGKRITIINNSIVVGKPLSLMLQQDPYNAPVTICHEYSEDIPFHVLSSEIVITAVGKYPKFKLPVSLIKPWMTIIDVAMNRVDGKLFGDVVDFNEAKEIAKYITPVPGCVGLCTVACLMKNPLLCAKCCHE